MNPQKKFNKELWSVLQAIKVFQGLSTDGKIRFQLHELEHYIPKETLPTELKLKIFDKLVQWNVLQKKTGGWAAVNSFESGSYEYYEANEEEFEKLYKQTSNLKINALQELDVQNITRVVETMLAKLLEVFQKKKFEQLKELVEVWEPELVDTMRSYFPKLNIKKDHVRIAVHELEKQGKIKVHTLPNDTYEQHFRVELCTPNQIGKKLKNIPVLGKDFFEKERDKSLAITTSSDHRLFRDKWLTVKRILDVIYKRLPPISTASRLPFSVELSSFPQHYVEDVLKTLLDTHITSYADPEKGTGITSSTYFRKYLGGNNIIINDCEKFEQYRERVSNLYAHIEEDGKKRFPDVYGVVESERSNGQDFSEEPNPHKSKKDRLQFWGDTGDLEYKNEHNTVKVGTKGFALMTVFSQQKNAPVALDELKERGNPLITKSEYFFMSEKDVDDTIREIKVKLKVKKGSYFPINKRGDVRNRKWTWLEK